MIKRGELTAHQVGRHIRISDSQLKAYLSQLKGSQNIFSGTVVHNDDEVMLISEQGKIIRFNMNDIAVKKAVEVITSTATVK